VNKLDQYDGFHDSKVRRISLQTAFQSLILEVDYPYDKILSPTGDLVIPNDKGWGPERYQTVYRSMVISFNGVDELVVKMESDTVNDEIILSCDVVEEKRTTDSCHVIILLSSMSKLDFYCRDFECKSGQKGKGARHQEGDR